VLAILRTFGNWCAPLGSVAANWIEADEAISKKDFASRENLSQRGKRKSAVSAANGRWHNQKKLYCS